MIPRPAVAAAFVVLAAGLAAPVLAAAPACPPPFVGKVDHLEGFRVFTGPDGLSKVERLRLDARTFKLKTGEGISILDLPTSPTRGVQIVTGPPNLSLAPHPTPYKEMFVLLAGSLTIKVGAFSADMKPGSVLLFDDKDAKDGHGGVIGPCGYTSISVAP